MWLAPGHGTFQQQHPNYIVCNLKNSNYKAEKTPDHKNNQNNSL